MLEGNRGAQSDRQLLAERLATEQRWKFLSAFSSAVFGSRNRHRRRGEKARSQKVNQHRRV